MTVELFIQRRGVAALGLLLGVSGCAGDPGQDDFAVPQESSVNERGPQGDQHDADAPPGDEPVADVALPKSVALSLVEVPPQSVAIAEALLDELVGSSMAPSWQDDVELADTVYVFHRTDFEGIAYFEFTTSAGGRILVSTGRHDSPVPSFSDVGGPIAELLVEQAAEAGQALDRLYRFNARDAAGLDRAGRVIAYTLRESLPEGGLSIDELEAELAGSPSADAWGPAPDASSGSVQKSGGAADLTADDEWSLLYPAADDVVTKSNDDPFDTEPTLAVANVKWLYHYTLLRSSIRWRQHDVDHDPAPDEVCWAGCGTVAWAQVAAYLAYSDRWGNPKYLNSKYRNFYPQVSTDKNAPQALALIEALYDELGAFCWPVTHQSAVSPSSMDNFVDWAARKGARVKLDTSWGTPVGGDSVAAYNAIRAGNPVILGWGNYLHYNVGVGAGTLNGARYVWVNNGQGDGRYDGWIRLNSTFFTGIVNSFVAGK